MSNFHNYIIQYIKTYILFQRWKPVLRLNSALFLDGNRKQE